MPRRVSPTPSLGRPPTPYTSGAPHMPTRTFLVSLIDEAYPGEVRRETVCAPNAAGALIRARQIFAHARILQIKPVVSTPPCSCASKAATRAALARQPVARFIGGEFKAFDYADEVALFDLNHAD